MSTIGLVWRFAAGANARIISEVDIDTPSDDDDDADDDDDDKHANADETLGPARPTKFVKRKLQLLPKPLHRQQGFKPPKRLVVAESSTPSAAARSSPCSSDISSSSVDSDDSNIRDYDAVAELRETRHMLEHLDDNDSDFEEMSKDTIGWQKV